MNAFEEAMAAGQGVIDAIFGEQAIIVPMRRATPNAAPAADPGRAGFTVPQAIFSEMPARIRNEGNGMGGVRAGGFTQAQAAMEIFVEIAESFGPLVKGDRVTRSKTGEVFSVEEIQPNSIRQWRRYRLNRAS